MLFHVTNLYLDLGPVLSDIAAKGGLYGRQRTDTAEDVAPGRYPSSWVVLTERTDTLKVLARDARWTDLASARTGGPAWMDDYSNVLGAFRSRG